MENLITELREEKRRDKEATRSSVSGKERSQGRFSVTMNRRSRYEETSREGSVWSMNRLNESLNEREIDKIRRIVKEKEKEERKNNIVIKGIIAEIMVTKEGVEKFIKEKIKLEVKVINYRKNGNVIIATLERREMKKKVMKYKNIKGK